MESLPSNTRNFSFFKCNIIYKNIYRHILKDTITAWRMSSGADAINISGLLVQESRLLNPKKLGNFNNRMLYKKILVVQTPISQKFRSLRSDKRFPTPNQGIPQLGVNFFIASAPGRILCQKSTVGEPSSVCFVKTFFCRNVFFLTKLLLVEEQKSQSFFNKCFFLSNRMVRSFLGSSDLSLNINIIIINYSEVTQHF